MSAVRGRVKSVRSPLVGSPRPSSPADTEHTITLTLPAAASDLVNRVVYAMQYGGEALDLWITADPPPGPAAADPPADDVVATVAVTADGLDVGALTHIAETLESRLGAPLRIRQTGEALEFVRPPATAPEEPPF